MIADYLLLKGAIINGGEPEKMTDQGKPGCLRSLQTIHDIQSLFLHNFRVLHSGKFSLARSTDREDNKYLKDIQINITLRSGTRNRFLRLTTPIFLMIKIKTINSTVNEGVKKYTDAPPIFSIIAARTPSKKRTIRLRASQCLRPCTKQSQNEGFKKVL